MVERDLICDVTKSWGQGDRERASLVYLSPYNGHLIRVAALAGGKTENREIGFGPDETRKPKSPM